MGPRFFDRGNQRVADELGATVDELQWGRGSLTAETNWVMTWSHNPDCFNGAAVL